MPLAPRTELASRRALFASVSALALVFGASQPASARPLGAGASYSAPTIASDAAGASAQQGALIAQQSIKSMMRANQALQAMLAAQAAARAAASQGNVPNGLAAGGLVPDSGLAGNGVANPVTSWIGATTPTQASAGGQTLVTVQQTQQKAILNWSSFNVGANTQLYVNQSAGNTPGAPNGWIALNRVVDPSGVPSQILGQIRAEGSVYLINANGIIFGGGSQINVASLIASSLNLFSNDPTASATRFLNGGIGDLNGSNTVTNSVLLTTTNPNAGPVTIQPGASINLATNGLAVIAAPNVSNGGTFIAPSGQVALVAGVGVSYGYNGSAGASTLLVFSNAGQLLNAQNADIAPVGTLVNSGLIYTPRGNITLLGGTVAQNGVAIATTSVKQSGSIVLSSQYDATPYTGSVSFGPQAVTAILPDSDGVTLASDATSLAPFTGNAPAAPLPIQGPGLISIAGQAIDFQGGTLVYAPGQAITAHTLVLPDPRPIAPLVPDPGRIVLEPGAVLDVSGIPDTVLSAAGNVLTVKLSGNELADSPLQRTGALYGESVTVDMRLTGTNAETGESWVGTPLANLASYLNLVQQPIGQLLVNGGSIALRANEFVGASGSIINLTGGYVEYQGGVVATTRLIGSDGRIYAIGSADPSLTYVGTAGQFTVDHPHWNVTEIYTDPLLAGGSYQQDYVQGGNAGTLSIQLSNLANGTSGNPVANSGALVLQSQILASAVAGSRQTASGALPSNASFSFSGVLPIEIGDPGVLSAQSAAAASVPANFSAAAPLLAVPGSAYATNVFNSQVLDSAGFAKIALGSGVSGPAASVVEDAGTSLVVQPGGSISLSGSNVTINGNLAARAGSISITTEPAGAPPVAGVFGDLVIASSAMLNVSGVFYNDVGLSAGASATPFVNGGSIALAANLAIASGGDVTGNITLAAGSVPLRST
jgi:filamentous hemagglutinin family protein